MRKEADKVQVSQFDGLECDSDEEEHGHASDTEYSSSDDESPRQVVDYDLDKMFQIIKYRDFHSWSLEHIHNRFNKIRVGEAGRKQLSR